VPLFGDRLSVDTPVFDFRRVNAVICAIQSPFSGAHSDIQHPEVLWAVVDAAGLGA
jgi:hypothetical protein